MCLGSCSVRRRSRRSILLLDRLLTEQDPRHTLYLNVTEAYVYLRPWIFLHFWFLYSRFLLNFFGRFLLSSPVIVVALLLNRTWVWWRGGGPWAWKNQNWNRAWIMINEQNHRILSNHRNHLLLMLKFKSLTLGHKGNVTCSLTDICTSIKTTDCIVNTIYVWLTNTPAVGDSSSALGCWRNVVHCRTRGLNKKHFRAHKVCHIGKSLFLENVLCFTCCCLWDWRPWVAGKTKFWFPDFEPSSKKIIQDFQKWYLVKNRQFQLGWRIRIRFWDQGLKTEMTTAGLVKKKSSKAQKHIHEIVAIWHPKLFRHMALKTC